MIDETMRRFPFCKLFVAAVHVWILCCPSIAEAQTIWFNTGTGNWTTSSNWTLGLPNQNVDAEVFRGTAQLSGSNVGITRRLTIDSIPSGFGRVEVFSVGNGIPSLQTAELRVGSDAVGFLGITQGGRVFSKPSVIGRLEGSVGTVNVNGFNPVTGSSSQWFAEGGTFDVGDRGTGFLNITNSGTLQTNAATIGKQAGGVGSVLVAGTTFTSWTVNSGNVTVGGVGTGKLTLADQAKIQFTGTGGSILIGSTGTFNFGFLSTHGLGTPGDLIGATSIVNNGQFNFDHTGNVSIATSITGAGSITQIASGTTTLSNVAAFTGSLRSANGLVIVNGGTSATSLVADGPGILRLQNGTLSIGLNSIRANTGGVVEYKNETINGGYLRGSGTHVAMAGAISRFNGVTSFNSTRIRVEGTGNFNNFQNGGEFTSNGITTFDGAINAGSGTVKVNATLNAIDFLNQGVLEVNNGGQVVNSAGNLVAGGGSRTNVRAGGSVILQNGTSLDLNGSLLVNNGTIDGTTNVYYGSLAKGAGVFGEVNVFDGGVFSPGNSPGAAILAAANFMAGGVYRVEIHDALGAAGVGYDTLDILGQLALTAGSTSNSMFTFQIASLNSGNGPGMAINFDPGHSYSFLIASAQGGITGFAPDQYQLDTGSFQNSLGTGSFWLSNDGNNLWLNFSSVPEPSSALLVMVVTAKMFFRRRRPVDETNRFPSLSF